MVARAPTADDLLNVWRRVVDANYRDAIEGDAQGSFALFRACAAAWAKLALNIQRSTQACFYLRHGYQVDEPSSSTVAATFVATLTRTLDAQVPVELAPGAVRLESLGRTYANVDTVTWIPYDDQQTKDVEFAAEVPGFAGNLEFIDDGTGHVRLDRIGFVDQAKDRTNIGGRVHDGTTLKDTGAPDVFEPVDVGLYVRLVSARDVANLPTADEGRTLRIVGYDDPFVEDPPGSGLRPKHVHLDVEELVQILGARADDGGVFTNQIAAAQGQVADDVTLLPAAPAVNDAYYFGLDTGTFSGLLVNTSTAGDGDWEIAWEYWNGAAWVDLPAIDDGTNAFRIAGERRVRWTVPGDWAAVAVDGQTSFWVRARVSAFTSIAAQPLGSYVVVLDRRELDVASVDVHWILLAWEDLGFELEQATLPEGGRDDDLYLLGLERKAFQQLDEGDEVFRERASRLIDVVSPAAIRRVVNRALFQVGKRGLAIDVQQGIPPGTSPCPGAPTGGFTGIYADVDFFEYYDVGDLFPEDPLQLQLSWAEAYGWIFLILPNLSLGEFGSTFDDGPVYYLDPPGEFIGPAGDHAFADGYAVTAAGLYASIYQSVDAIRAGGVGITVLRAEEVC